MEENREMGTRTSTNDEFVLVNVYENMVRDIVDEMIEYMEMCHCSKCVNDACALVLNQVMPRYVTTKQGELLSQMPRLQMDKQIDLTVMVVKALNLVRESPHH